MQLSWRLGGILADRFQRAHPMRSHLAVRELPEFERATRANTFAIGRGIPGMVWQRGEPLWMKDVTDVPLPRQEIARREGLHAAFAFPVFALRANMTRHRRRMRPVDATRR
jgi:hypothetical protein